MTSNKREKKVFYIKGMHCASCKKIIEQRLVDRGDIESATVNMKDESVIVTFKKRPITTIILTEEFSDVGYTFTDEPSKKVDYKKMIISLSIALVVFFILLQSEKLMSMSSISANENSSIIAFLILGAVASVSSCVALVGGIILSMTKSWANVSTGNSFSQKMEPHLKFHVGRLIAYVLGGGILGLVGSLITFNNPIIYATLILIISVIMFSIGLQMIGVRWVVNMYSYIYAALLGKNKLNSEINNKSPLIIGATTLFLPCGFTLIAQSAALASGSFIAGAAIMGIFVLGTFPVLLGISFGGVALFYKKKFASAFNFVIGTIIIVFSLYTINGQLNVLGLPSFSDIDLSQSEDVGIDEKSDNDKTNQELYIVADGFEYTIIGSNILKAGVPTKMIVDNRGIAGCGAYMAAHGLLDDWQKLESGFNEFEFTPQAGTYKITCTMGMVQPITVIVK